MSIEQKLQEWAKQKMNKMYEIAEEEAKKLEQEMKTHAPWQDQTGKARRGLHATPTKTDNEIGIRIGHGVDYGIYLENAKNGTLAIIKPTFLKHRKLPIEIAKKAMR